MMGYSEDSRKLVRTMLEKQSRTVIYKVKINHHAKMKTLYSSEPCIGLK